MPIPSLTRQNAFILEENQTKSPLDMHCSVCHNESLVNGKYIQPCRCELGDTISLYAHQTCFINWFMDNGYPKQCPNCKSNYNVTFFSFFIFTVKRKRYQLILSSILLFIFLYFLVHVTRCTVLQILTRNQFIARFGEQYRNVPERLILPRISISCLQSSFRSSLHSLFISSLHCICIIALSITFPLVYFFWSFCIK